jgi:hypothetical protein
VLANWYCTWTGPEDERERGSHGDGQVLRPRARRCWGRGDEAKHAGCSRKPNGAEEMDGESGWRGQVRKICADLEPLEMRWSCGLLPGYYFDFGQGGYSTCPV